MIGHKFRQDPNSGGNATCGASRHRHRLALYAKPDRGDGPACRACRNSQAHQPEPASRYRAAQAKGRRPRQSHQAARLRRLRYGFRLNGLALGQDTVGALQARAPALGQGQAAGGSVEQCCPYSSFQTTYCLRDRRLGKPQFRRCPRKRSHLRHLGEDRPRLEI